MPLLTSNVRVKKMNPIHIAQIGIRIVSIYLIAQGISNIPDVYLFFTTYDPEGEYTAVIYGSVFTAIFSPAIIGCLLWFVAPKLSRHLISSQPTSENNQALNINQFQSTVIVLIGVYIISISIPAALSINYHLYAGTIEVNGDNTLNSAILANAIAANLKLLFGVSLLFGSKLIVRGITKIRTIGTN